MRWAGKCLPPWPAVAWTQREFSWTNSIQTGGVKVHLDDGGHRFEILDLQAYDFIDPTVAHLVRPPRTPALIYYGTLAQRHVASRRALASLLHTTKAPKFLDVNLRAPWYTESTLAFSLEMADIVKLNDQELQELADMFGLSSGNSHGQATDLMHRFDLAQMAVTCGAQGAWQMDRAAKWSRLTPADWIMRWSILSVQAMVLPAVFLLGTLRPGQQI